MYFPVFDPYDDNHNFSNNDELCLICWENESTEIVIPFKKFHQYPTHCQCNGQFHLSCIEEWIKINNSCPICREKIIDLNACEHSVIIIINTCTLIIKTIRSILLFFQFCILITIFVYFIIFYSTYRN